MKDYSAAFPTPAVEGHYNVSYHPAESGMCLRDWFAGQAIVGMLTSDPGPCDRMAIAAYEIADAMMKARID